MSRNFQRPVTLFVLVGVILLPTPGRGEEEKPQPLSLNDCYALALNRSENDRIQAAEFRIAEARYREALGGFVPELGLFASKTWNDRIESGRDSARDPRTDLESGRWNPQFPGFLFRHTPTTNPYFGGLFLKLPLFNGFSNYYDSRALKFEIRNSSLTRKRARELLYLDVAAIFYQIQSYRKTLTVLLEEKAALEERTVELMRYARLGRARPSELLAARADQASNGAEAANLRGLLNTSLELLAFLTGRPATALSLHEEPEGEKPAALAAYLQGAGERKDILAAAALVNAERARLRGARGGHLPRVSLESNYYLDQSPDSGRDWNVYLRIELPLFSGGRTARVVEQGEARLMKSELNLQRLRRTAEYEIRSAYNDYTAWAAQMIYLVEAARLYGDAHAAQKREYRFGIVRNLEVLESLRRMYQARRALLGARYSYYLSRVRLHIAAGKKEP